MPRLSATFNGDFNKAFLSHLIRVASHVKERLPNARIIIWDDMLHNMDEAELISFVYFIYFLFLFNASNLL